MNNEFSINEVEIDKINMNRILFSIHKRDHFEIDDVLNILNTETIPTDIPINNNNSIFIRDLSSYIILNNLKPNISK